MSTHTIIQGDVLKGLASLPDESVQCVVTSPPYWGLRDYGVEGQIGLEPTPEEYVEKMVAVFRGVRRVLRDDGTIFLNLGDSYAGSGKGPSTSLSQPGQNMEEIHSGIVPDGLKPKDLVGMPWRLAFALQADGWVLRSDIIWSKKNPMPESVKDRPIKSHEYLFLLSKADWTGEDPGQFKDITDEDARWLALFIETEGNIVIKRGVKEQGGIQYGCQIAIANTSRPLLEEVQRITRAGNILERKGKNHPVSYWQISNKVGRDLLYRIYPFLISKRRQAKIAIYLESLLYHRGCRKPERKQRTSDESQTLERLWRDNKLCNHFGAPDLSYIPEPEFGHWNSPPYYYDADAIREKYSPSSEERAQYKEYREGSLNPAGRNRRTVWEIPTQPYEGAHFATFPEALVEPCIKAGTSERGACPKCGSPWERVVEKGEPDEEWKAACGADSEGEYQGVSHKQDALGKPTYTGFNARYKATQVQNASDVKRRILAGMKERISTWSPTCTCGEEEPVPCVVLDPFGGSGTVAKVARDLGRSSVSIELNPAYVEMIKKRLRFYEQLSPEVQVAEIR